MYYVEDKPGYPSVLTAR